MTDGFGLRGSEAIIAVAEVKLARIDQATQHYEAALRLKPDYTDACNNFA